MIYKIIEKIPAFVFNVKNLCFFFRETKEFLFNYEKATI